MIAAAIIPMSPELERLQPAAVARGHALLHKGACRAEAGGGCSCSPALVLRPDILRDEHDLKRHVRAALREWRRLQARGRN